MVSVVVSVHLNHTVLAVVEITVPVMAVNLLLLATHHHYHRRPVDMEVDLPHLDLSLPPAGRIDRYIYARAPV